MERSEVRLFLICVREETRRAPRRGFPRKGSLPLQTLEKQPEKGERHGADLNREPLAGPVFETGALPD